jgi:hypothetical protein
LIGLLFTFYRHDRYENSVFTRIENQIRSKTSGSTEDSLIIHTLHLTYNLLSNRERIFKDELDGMPIRNDIYYSVSDDLFCASHACGSYTRVLSKILQDMGFTIRIAQMTVSNRHGAHIIMEAKTKKGWVVLDPLYDLYFINETGGLASFKDVSANWNFFKKTLPAGYDTSYRYEAVQYTNWEKIPFLMPVIKSSLDKMIGKNKADEISLRPYFLSNGKYYCGLIILLILLLTTHMIYLVRRKTAIMINRKAAAFKIIYKRSFGLTGS